MCANSAKLAILELDHCHIAQHLAYRRPVVA